MAGALTGATGHLLVAAHKTSVDLHTFAVLSGASKETIMATGKALIDSATNAYLYDTAAGALCTITATGIEYFMTIR